MVDKLLQALERKRSDYDAECEWHSFLLDSYTGAGGYQGSIRQPLVGWWGAAAERYARDTLQRNDAPFRQRTYLDRYPREDEEKFKARLEVAHLWNYVGPLTDLKLSYFLRKGINYQNQPPDISAWREDVDGHGASWDELRPLVALLAATLGWCPVLLDMDPAMPGESVAQARERGAGRPRAIPLVPSNLVDWSHDGYRFAWAKVRTDHVEQTGWDAEPERVCTYRIWSPTTVATYEVREPEGRERYVRDLGESPHPFGEVPIAIFRHAPLPGDRIRGLPMHAAPARAQKRLYNLLSELDEHMRSQVFAVLVLARKGENGGEITLGVDNALTLDPEASQKHYYMSPDSGVAATYEKRIESTISEGIYRPARVEYARATASAVSGVARAYEFAQTNRAIADFASEWARGEERMDRLAWAGMGRDPRALESYSAQAPQDFGVEDLAAELERTIMAVSEAGLGPTMVKRLRLRLAEHLDPQMPPDVRKVVESELDEVAEQEAVDRAMAREMAAAGARGEGENPPDAEDDPEERDE